MPPKAKDPNGSPAAEKAPKETPTDGIDNYELPRALVTRIAKSSIPENAKMQKETVTALMKGSTVFINYLAATAHDIATSRQHKTVNATDVLKALEVLQFGDIVPPLQNELEVFRENVKMGKKSTSARAPSSKSSKGKERAQGQGSSTASASANINTQSDDETQVQEEEGEADHDQEDDEDEGGAEDELGEDDGEGGEGDIEMADNGGSGGTAVSSDPPRRALEAMDEDTPDTTK